MDSTTSLSSILESSLQGYHHSSSNSGSLWDIASWLLLLCHPVPVSGILFWVHFSSSSCCPLLSQGAEPLGYIAQAPKSANGSVDRRLKVVYGITGNPGLSSVTPKPLEGGPLWSPDPAHQEHHLNPFCLHPRASFHVYFANF